MIIKLIPARASIIANRFNIFFKFSITSVGEFWLLLVIPIASGSLLFSWLLSCFLSSSFNILSCVFWLLSSTLSSVFEGTYIIVLEVLRFALFLLFDWLLPWLLFFWLSSVLLSVWLLPGLLSVWLLSESGVLGVASFSTYTPNLLSKPP